MFKQSIIVLVALSAFFCLSLADVQEQVEAAAESVQDQAQNLPGGSLLEKLQPHVKGLFDITKDTSMNFYEQAKPLVANMGNDLMQSADSYLQRNPALKDNLQKVVPHLSRIHGTAMNLVNQGGSLVSGILNRYGQQGSDMAQQAQNVAGEFGESVNSFASQAGEAVSSATEKARETMGSFTGQASSVAGKLVEQARNVANPSALGEQATDALNSVADQAKNAVNPVVEQVNNVVNQWSSYGSS